MNILDVWTHIEESFDDLPVADRRRVMTEAKPYGPKFRGFDGNYEGDQYSIAKFLIERTGRFSNIDSKKLNSHMPTLDGYRRMVAAHKKTNRGASLSANEIVRLLKLQGA